MHIYIHTNTINALNIPQWFVLKEDKILLTRSSNGVRMTWCIDIENIYCCFTYILMPRNIIIYFRIPYFHVSNGAIFFLHNTSVSSFHIDVFWTLCFATHLSETITNAFKSTEHIATETQWPPFADGILKFILWFLSFNFLSWFKFQWNSLTRVQYEITYSPDLVTQWFNWLLMSQLGTYCAN